MSIIYVLIAREPDRVLCDFTEYSGNFQQITRIFLLKIKGSSKCTISYDKYNFQYIASKGLIFLCMTDHYPNHLAFSLLIDLESIFIKQYTNLEEIKKFYSYEIDKRFKSYLKELVNHYQIKPKLNYFGKSLEQLDRLKEIEYNDVDNFLEKNERLHIIAIKSSSKSEISYDINSKNKEIRTRKWRVYIIGILSVVILIVLIVVFLSNLN